MKIKEGSEQSKNKSFDDYIFESLIFKTVYNLKLPREYSIHFSPVKKKLNLDLSTLPKMTKNKVLELLTPQSQLSNYCSTLSDFKLINENKKEHRETISLFLSSIYSEQEDSRWKFNYEKMDIALSFYQKIIYSQELVLEHLTKEHLASLYQQVAVNKKEEIKKLGKSILVVFLGYAPDNLTDEFTYSIGKTKYFFSYNQNLLEHLLEVSILSANFASLLKLNAQKAKRAAFFHDIGKITGQHSNHVSAGIELANYFKLEPYILETIQYHHNYEIRWETPYLPIVRAMDKLSAGRLGARPLQLEKTRERNEQLQAILSPIEEISKIEFLAGGHIIKLHLNPAFFSKDNLEKLKSKVSKLVSEADLKYQYNYQFLLKLEFEDSFMMEDYLKTL